MSLPQLFANSPTPGSLVALTTLSGNSGGGISSGALTMNVAGSAPTALTYPGQFYVVVDSEIMLVTGGASTTTWTILRQQEGSSPATHSDGTPVYPYLTAGGLANMLAEAASSLQPGVITTDAFDSDLLISAITINGASGALGFTPHATGVYPAWVANTANMLVPVGYLGSVQSIIPPTLPTANNYMVVGVEIDTTGAVSLNSGAAENTLPLATADAIRQKSPATTSGTLRIADIAIHNNGTGTPYEFGDLTTVATKGINWVDRRPHARGAYRFSAGATSSPTTALSSYTLLDNFVLRLELGTGAAGQSGPTKITLTGDFSHTTAGKTISFQPYLDTAPISPFSFTGDPIRTFVATAAGQRQSFSATWHLSIGPGSHQFAIYWATNAATATATVDARHLIVEEKVSRNVLNGTV